MAAVEYRLSRCPEGCSRAPHTAACGVCGHCGASSRRGGRGWVGGSDVTAACGGRSAVASPDRPQRSLCADCGDGRLT